MVSINHAAGEVEVFLRKLFRDAGRLVSSDHKALTEEQLHDARVAIKKIKAAFHLLQFCYPSAETRNFKKLDRLFEQAGKVRENQLLQAYAVSRAGADPSCAELLRLLEKKTKQAQQQFLAASSRFDRSILKQLRHEMAAGFQTISEPQVRVYFSTHLNRIRQKLEETHLPFGEYHQLRKYLKELKYNQHFAGLEVTRNVQATISNEDLDQLEELLGKWHDLIMAISDLYKLMAKITLSASVIRLVSRLIMLAGEEAGALRKNMLELMHSQAG